MAYSLGAALNGFFKNAHPLTQIISIVCLTCIAISGMILGYTDVAFISIISFSPVPTLTMINLMDTVNRLTRKFDVMAVASQATPDTPINERV